MRLPHLLSVLLDHIGQALGVALFIAAAVALWIYVKGPN